MPPQGQELLCLPCPQGQPHTLCLAEAQWLGWQVFYLYQLCTFKVYRFSCSLTDWAILLLYFKNKCILHEILRQVRVFYVCTSVLYKHKYAVAVQELPVGSHPCFHLKTEMRPYDLICKLLFNRDMRNTLCKAAGQMDCPGSAHGSSGSGHSPSTVSRKCSEGWSSSSTRKKKKDKNMRKNQEK